MEAADGDDHYAVLGLPSGEEGAKLSIEEIRKAYRAKALIYHPDKNPNNPNANITFQRIKSSYEILSDQTGRAAFDALILAKLDRLRRTARVDSKRRKMMADLDERERAAEAPDPAEIARREEEKAAKKFQQEVARIREMHAKKVADAAMMRGAAGEESAGTAMGGEGLDKERILKVSWERVGEDYSVERLKELFGRFGGVEDVVIRGKGSKKRKSALVVMESKEAMVAATKCMGGVLSNALFVSPLLPNTPNESNSSSTKCTEREAPDFGKLIGAGYQAYEDSILNMLRKAAEKQKLDKSQG